jgi:hypothetical protein
VATADAQTPPTKGPVTKPDPNEEVKRLQAELDKARLAAEASQKVQEHAKDPKYLSEALQQYLAQSQRDTAAQVLLAHIAQQRNPKETAAAKTSKWEYDFVAVSDMTQSKFVAFLQDRENRGWEYNGTTTLTHQGKPAEIWVFRRPAKGAEGYPQLIQDYYQRAANAARQQAPQALGEYRRLLNSQLATKPGGTASDPKTAEEVAREIARLQDQLARLNAKPMMDRVVVPTKELPLEATELLTVLSRLADRKFGNERYSLAASSNGLTIDGDKEVIDWFRTMIKRLGEK